MKWTVLSDNRTNDSRFETEHGLSILLETDKHRILLDTGASDVFIRNAEKMGIDLSTVDYVFISHGHSDHAGGLKHFLNVNERAKIIVSPDAVNGKFFSKRGNLHSITAEWPMIDDGRLVLIVQTCAIAEDIHVIAHIPQNHPMPKGNQNLYVQNTNGDYIHDDFRHELALYVDGLLFTGCAHSGLENILAACPWPVHTVVGGFHLLDGQETEEELTALAQRLKAKYPETQFYTSHCTGDKVFAILTAVMGEQLHAFNCGPDMQTYKKILFLHGFYASGSCVPALALKEAFEKRATVLTPDLPLHPADALRLIREICDKEKPDILVGNSCGSFYAQIISPIIGVPALLGNPHFKMTEFLRERIGNNQYKSPRADGKQNFVIDEALIEEFAEMEATQFNNCNPDFKDRNWGLFGEKDTLAHFESTFLEHYNKTFHFPGGHTPTADEVRNWYVPLAEKLLKSI